MKKFIQFANIVLVCASLFSCQQKKTEELHVFEIKEIQLNAQDQYENPYTEVECWVDLKGPDFDKRIYGFWDGGQEFKVRVVAIKPGEWSWISGSTSSSDVGLNNQTGSFEAIEWTEEEKEANNNRRGFIRPTSNGHALEHADGTPFFFIGDTWLAASTWRYPLTGNAPDSNWVPGPEGLSLENMIHYRKKHGYNSFSMIACYPSWDTDEFPNNIVDENGIAIRKPWEQFGTTTAKDMHDELGNKPFAISDKPPMADFDQIIPAYFQSLDKKMDYINSVGFVPLLETVRRDHAPSWKAYFEWPGSFTRYIQYIVARYGAYNILFSPIHLDWIDPVYSLPGDVFNEAIMTWFERYGGMPFGQTVTNLINGATHLTYGTGDTVFWLDMHAVGNTPRDHGFYPWLEFQFRLDPPKPTANLEPYYAGWRTIYPTSIVAGEVPENNSDRDNYFARTQAWGSVLSGGLAGHVYGTGAYDGTTVGEEKGIRLYIWEALKYPAGKQIGYLRKFIMSEGDKYQNLQLDSENLDPCKSSGSLPDGLDGWAFMMSLPDKTMAMLYFENKCEIPKISGLVPNRAYQLKWFNPITGEWHEEKQNESSDDEGSIQLTSFPDGAKISVQDWSLKILLVKKDVTLK